jgi:hypothetical protein
MSKLIRTLTLAATLAAIQLAAVTTVAHASASSDRPSVRHHALGRLALLAADDHAVAAEQPSTAEATVRRLLARERFSIPDADQTAAQPRLLLEEPPSSLLNLPNHATPAQAASPTQSAAPSSQPGWLTPALGVLAAVMALVAGVAMLAARRANRGHRASQTA